MRSCRMPAAIAKVEDQRAAARDQRAEHDCIGEDKAGMRIDEGSQQKRGRKDQGLRIGDLRRARKNVWGPEGRLSAVERPR